MKAMFPPARMLSLTIIPDNAEANVGNGVQAGSEGRRLVGMSECIYSCRTTVPPFVPSCVEIREKGRSMPSIKYYNESTSRNFRLKCELMVTALNESRSGLSYCFTFERSNLQIFLILLSG